MHNSRKAFLVSAAFALSLSAVTGVSHAADRIQLTVPVFTAGYANYFIALDKGYFKEEGLDVQIVKAGGGTATPALMSGKIQFSGSPGSALSAILRGAPLKIIYASQDHPAYELWSGDPKIQKVEDLKGKSVGVISRGGTHELGVRLVLMHYKVPASSVSFTPMGWGRGRLAGVLSGSLAAASLTTDEVEQARKEKGMHRVADTKAIAKMLVGGAATSDTMLKNNRGLAKRFLRAAIKGRRYMLTFKDPAVDAVLKRNTKAPRKAMERAYANTLAGATKGGTITPQIQAQEVAIRSTILKIPPAKQRKPSEVFDFSLLDEINQELDAAGWKPQR